MQYIFLVVYVCVVSFILWQNLTRKGKNVAVQTTFGGKVVQDLGIIEESRVFAGHQIIRLLRCEDNGEQFYVLETRNTVVAGIQYYWTRIDQSTLDKLTALIK